MDTYAREGAPNRNVAIQIRAGPYQWSQVTRPRHLRRQIHRYHERLQARPLLETLARPPHRGRNRLPPTPRRLPGPSRPSIPNRTPPRPRNRLRRLATRPLARSRNRPNRPHLCPPPPRLPRRRPVRPPHCRPRSLRQRIPIPRLYRLPYRPPPRRTQQRPAHSPHPTPILSATRRPTPASRESSPCRQHFCSEKPARK